MGLELDLLPTHPWRLWLHLTGFPFPVKGRREDSRQPGCCEGEKHRKAAGGCGKLLSAVGLQLKLIMG